MPTVTISGIELAHRVAGQDHGAPALFIHGYTGNLRNWSLQVKALAATGQYRCLSADNPGHGDSSAPADARSYEFDQVADLLHQLAVDAAFAPAIVFGHSMGGAIAEQYAIRYPEHVRALVLVGSAGGASGPERTDKAEPRAALRAAYAQGGMSAVYDVRLKLTPMPGYDALPDATKTFLRAEFARTHWNGFEFGGRALHTRQETLTALADFNKPTLIVHGAAESESLQHVSRDLTRTIRTAKRVVIANAGHSPQFENPNEFNREMFAFLATL